MTEKFRLYKGAWIFRDSPHKEKKLSSEQKKQLLDQILVHEYLYQHLEFEQEKYLHSFALFTELPLLENFVEQTNQKKEKKSKI